MKKQGFSFEIVCDKTNEDFLKEFFKLAKDIAGAKVGYGYSALNKARVLIVKTQKEEELTSVAVLKIRISECFCSAFITNFKYKLFKETIKIDGVDDALGELLIKALCFFDKQVDEEVIRQELLKLKGNKIYLESFFNFRLRPLKARYLELATIINLNIINFIQSETFTQFLKFLIESIEQSDKTIVVNMNKAGEIEYEDLTGLNVLLFLIKESPKKIIIKTKDVKSEGASLIAELFDDRVEFK